VSSTLPGSLTGARTEEVHLTDDAEEKDLAGENDLAVEAEAVGLRGLVTDMASTARRPLRI